MDIRPSPYYLKACPLCGGSSLPNQFVSRDLHVARCQDCSLLMLNPQPSDETLAKIYSSNYFSFGEGGLETEMRYSEMKRATARLYLEHLGPYLGAQRGQLLEVGCGHGYFLLEARSMGFTVTGVDVSPEATEVARSKLGNGSILCGTVDHLDLRSQWFDICVLSDVIEHTRDPVSFLGTIHQWLKPSGVLFIATPSLDSVYARLLKQNWMEFKLEHMFYFSRETIQHLLFKTGYHQVVVRSGKKVLNSQYIYQHFERFPVPGLTPLVRWVDHLMPQALRSRAVNIPTGGMLVMARTRPVAQRRKLSVIVPAYNEKATFRTLMDSLLQKEMDGLDMEIIVVESNSTDGTHEEAFHYQTHPRVKVVFEERPRGKGRAVRTGFEHMTGDFVLIQDADLEYDLDDYDSLLRPLMRCSRAFVLGSRHIEGNTHTIRQFEHQPVLEVFLNFGHSLFLHLFNLIYAQRLKDPFTMYKVFRRDCLYDLTFECNRFDFDYELVIKLIRKGYVPVEIPVTYRSRSFKQGKKVSVLKDPPTWIWALIKFRFRPLYSFRNRDS